MIIGALDTYIFIVGFPFVGIGAVRSSYIVVMIIGALTTSIGDFLFFGTGAVLPSWSMKYFFRIMHSSKNANEQLMFKRRENLQ